MPGINVQVEDIYVIFCMVYLYKSICQYSVLSNCGTQSFILISEAGLICHTFCIPCLHFIMSIVEGSYFTAAY